MKNSSKKFVGLLMVFVLFTGVFCVSNTAHATTTHVKEGTIMVYDKDQYVTQITTHIEYQYKGSEVVITNFYAIPARPSNSYRIEVITKYTNTTPVKCLVIYELYLNNVLIKNPTHTIVIS